MAKRQPSDRYAKFRERRKNIAAHAARLGSGSAAREFGVSLSTVANACREHEVTPALATVSRFRSKPLAILRTLLTTDKSYETIGLMHGATASRVSKVMCLAAEHDFVRGELMERNR